ncbi:head-tail connector protein [Halobacillus shinanisalinarum]|uniref:Head-tail connector protein n=1 Tax=Halobacillus shinanisalinarum TaxID=2932258 RepID=A0ABY4GZP8_9BACI|nr:head-tail connector protein [Halobacillus shinanisalinarum]UOQ93411.1 head-tail connector protein [Halobacillus shinanisalinarum]
MLTAEQFLPEIKNWLRIDGSEDDQILTSLFLSAKEFLKGAGIPEPDPPSERYKIAILLMVSNGYENRSPVVVGSSASDLPFSLQTFILQLKAEALPSESDVT